MDRSEAVGDLAPSTQPTTDLWLGRKQRDMPNVVPSGPQRTQDPSEALRFREGLGDDNGPIPAAKDIFEHRLDAHTPRRQLAEIPCRSVGKHPSQTEPHVLGI